MAGASNIIFGGSSILDLTNDTVTPETLLEGYTAHAANGDRIVGTASGGGVTNDKSKMIRYCNDVDLETIDDVFVDPSYFYNFKQFSEGFDLLAGSQTTTVNYISRFTSLQYFKHIIVGNNVKSLHKAFYKLLFNFQDNRYPYSFSIPEGVNDLSFAFDSAYIVYNNIFKFPFNFSKIPNSVENISGLFCNFRAECVDSNAAGNVQGRSLNFYPDTNKFHDLSYLFYGMYNYGSNNNFNYMDKFWAYLNIDLPTLLNDTKVNNYAYMFGGSNTSKQLFPNSYKIIFRDGCDYTGLFYRGYYLNLRLDGIDIEYCNNAKTPFIFAKSIVPISIYIENKHNIDLSYGFYDASTLNQQYGLSFNNCYDINVYKVFSSSDHISNNGGFHLTFNNCDNVIAHNVYLNRSLVGATNLNISNCNNVICTDYTPLYTLQPLRVNAILSAYATGNIYNINISTLNYAFNLAMGMSYNSSNSRHYINIINSKINGVILCEFLDRNMSCNLTDSIISNIGNDYTSQYHTIYGNNISLCFNPNAIDAGTRGVSSLNLLGATNINFSNFRLFHYNSISVNNNRITNMSGMFRGCRVLNEQIKFYYINFYTTGNYYKNLLNVNTSDSYNINICLNNIDASYLMCSGDNVSGSASNGRRFINYASSAWERSFRLCLNNVNMKGAFSYNQCEQRYCAIDFNNHFKFFDIYCNDSDLSNLFDKFGYSDKYIGNPYYNEIIYLSTLAKAPDYGNHIFNNNLRYINISGNNLNLSYMFTQYINGQSGIYININNVTNSNFKNMFFLLASSNNININFVDGIKCNLSGMINFNYSFLRTNLIGSGIVGIYQPNGYTNFYIRTPGQINDLLNTNIYDDRNSTKIQWTKINDNAYFNLLRYDILNNTGVTSSRFMNVIIYNNL